MTVGKINQTALEAVILDGNEHTYKSLCTLYAADHTQSMQIDRTLQKLRRAKKIAFRRTGGKTIWHKVPVA